MKTSNQLGLMLVLIIIMACGQVSKKSPIDIESEREAVIAEFKDLIVVSESGDVEGYMNHLSEDVVMMYSGQPAIVGTAKIRSFITNFFENYKFEFNPWQSNEIQVMGDWALHRYSAIATITPKSGGESIKLDRKYIDILRKEAGSWKVTHHIYNTNN